MLIYRELDSRACLAWFDVHKGGMLSCSDTRGSVDRGVAQQVYQYNVDAIMGCFLPWHDTVAFARMVQLLDLKGSR